MERNERYRLFFYIRHIWKKDVTGSVINHYSIHKKSDNKYANNIRYDNKALAIEGANHLADLMIAEVEKILLETK